MEPISVRPIAIWRFSGPTRSLVRLSATGNTPPEPIPARIRDANNSQNDVAIAPRILASPSSTRHTIISRALPNRSAAASKHRLDNRKGEGEDGGETGGSRDADAEIVGHMRQHRIQCARGQAGSERREGDDIEGRRQAARCSHSKAFLANASKSISRFTSASNSRSGTMFGPSDGA
jgi:hypothetical protein